MPREANRELWAPSSAALHLRCLLFETGSLTGFDAVQSGLPVSAARGYQMLASMPGIYVGAGESELSS